MWRALLDVSSRKLRLPLSLLDFTRVSRRDRRDDERTRRESGVRAPLFHYRSPAVLSEPYSVREEVRRLERADFKVLTRAEVPTNDGGLALGQAAIGGARLIDEAKRHSFKGGIRVAGA